MKKFYHAKNKPDETGIAAQQKEACLRKKLLQETEEHCVIIKGLLYHEDINLNHICNAKYIKYEFENLHKNNKKKMTSVPSQSYISIYCIGFSGIDRLSRKNKIHSNERRN